MSLVWINDQLIPKAEARVSPFDHGFLYGDGVWEPLRVFGSRVFRLQEHIAQLLVAAGSLGIDVPLSPADLAAAVEAAVRANHRVEGYIRAIITRGPGTIGPDPRKLDPQVIVIAEEYYPFPTELHGHGLYAATVVAPAAPERALGQPHLVQAKRHALRCGCLEAIRIDSGGQVLGTTEGGLFLVRGGAVHPVQPVPMDVHWQAVRDLGGEPARVAQSAVSVDDLFTADEIVLAGTSCGVIGIVRVDGKEIGTGTEGPATRQLRESYRHLTRGE